MSDAAGYFAVLVRAYHRDIEASRALIPTGSAVTFVRFEPARDGRGTDVCVSLQYDPLGGEAAHALASMLGQDPGRRIDEDLQAFKRAFESSAA